MEKHCYIMNANENSLYVLLNKIYITDMQSASSAISCLLLDFEFNAIRFTDDGKNVFMNEG